MKRTLLMVALLALILPGTATAYTPLEDADGDVIEPNPYVTGNVTISNHKAECEDDVLCFHDDSDDADNLADYGFLLHTDKVDEPIQFTPAKVDHQYYAEDSDAKSTVTGWGGNISDKSWTDTANWAGTGLEGSGNEVLERVLRNGAHALHFKNTGASTAEADTWTLDFTDITSEVAKTRLILGVEVVSINTGVDIAIYDGDGTGYERFDLRTSGTADGSTNVLMNGTGTVYWDELVTDGAETSGGVSGDISKLSIAVYSDSDLGASEIYVYALGLDVKRQSFGTNDLGEDVYNMTYTDCEGTARTTPLGYTCLAEFAPSFSYQAVKDLKVAYILEASSLPEDQVGVIAGETDDDTYPWQANYEFTFELPKMLDLTYAGDEALKYALPVSGGQHEVVKVAGTDKIKDIEKKKAGDTVSLSTSLANKETEVEFTILYTDAQMLATTEGTAFGIFKEGGFFYTIWAKLAGLAVVGVVFAKAMSRKRKA